MRAGPAWLRTSSLWAALAAALGLLQLVAAAPTPALAGPTAAETWHALSPFRALLPLALAAAAFGLFYLWCERGWGRAYEDRLGQAQAWLWILGSALVTMPGALLTWGPARGPEAPDTLGWVNLMPLAGAVMLFCGILAFIGVCIRGLWSVLALSEAPS